LTVCGANEESMSPGTSISTGPISVNTVFERVQLRSCHCRGQRRRVLVAEMFCHFRVHRGFEDVLGELIEEPALAHQFDALLLGLSQELLGQLFEDPPRASAGVRDAVAMRT
jgi:hypothetical protein